MSEDFQYPQDAPPPVEVPFVELSTDALRGVVESFVLREGTDYGERDYSLEQKVAHVMRQLARGEAKIMFDPASESVTLVTNSPASARTPPPAGAC